MEKSEYLGVMRAEHIPEAWANVWFVRKALLGEPRPLKRKGKDVILPAGLYTFLHRLTDATIYRNPPGEIVMEDTPFELNTHLGFVMRARGRVLVTGLGLGCVIRGLLANPVVEHVTVIENSPDVLRLVAPHMPADRLSIVEAEALEWTAKNQESFDCAWHDLWTDRGNGEPHLTMWHTQLLANCRRFIKRQGAWDFPREGKRKISRAGVEWIG